MKGGTNRAETPPLRDVAFAAYDAWRDYFDADERGDFWAPLVLAMGRLGTVVKGRDMTEPNDADGAEWAAEALSRLPQSTQKEDPR